MGLTFHRADPVNDQLQAIRRTLTRLDRIERDCGLPPLAEQDLDRAFEIRRRVDVMETMDTRMGRRGSLLTIAAHCVAGLMWLDRAELADPFSGDDVEAA